LILSIHETERYILENLKRLNRKPKLLNLCMCILEHIKTKLSLHKI